MNRRIIKRLPSQEFRTMSQRGERVVKKHSSSGISVFECPSDSKAWFGETEVDCLGDSITNIALPVRNTGEKMLVNLPFFQGLTTEDKEALADVDREDSHLEELDEKVRNSLARANFSLIAWGKYLWGLIMSTYWGKVIAGLFCVFIVILVSLLCFWCKCCCCACKCAAKVCCCFYKCAHKLEKRARDKYIRKNSHKLSIDRTV